MKTRRNALRLALAAGLVGAGLFGSAIAGGTSVIAVPLCQEGYGSGKWNLPQAAHPGELHGVLVKLPGDKKVYRFDGKLAFSPTFGPLPPTHGTLHGALVPLPSLSPAAKPPGKYLVHGTWKLTSKFGGGTFQASILPATPTLAPSLSARVKPVGKMSGVFSDPPPGPLSLAADSVGAFKCKWVICP